jgi:hypothetical protein
MQLPAGNLGLGLALLSHNDPRPYTVPTISFLTSILPGGKFRFASTTTLGTRLSHYHLLYLRSVTFINTVPLLLFAWQFILEAR